MTTPRFFVPAEWLRDERVVLRGEVYHQVGRVLRMAPGDELILLDNSGWETVVRLIEMSGEQGTAETVARRVVAAEPRTKITLYQSVLKGNHFEFALQKGTELGVVEFVPMITDRSIVADLDAASRKERRWSKILQEAAEQSGRGRIPYLRPVLLFPRACERARRTGGLSLLPWEGEQSTSLRALLTGEGQATEAFTRLLAQANSEPSSTPEAVTGGRRPRPFSVNVFVGPEGGFSAAEAATARGYGI
ncbi:MAG: 16S rRNA (uracil(1498)-N(3))-methyltransferase, partial [Chloroflexi bacterium]|nr:16S rRNA (uracil(1498)-N(3))-methyltransferase [Chloroflexota bacterium]